MTTTAPTFTDDEREILRLYAEGLPPLTIAEDLCITIKDVRAVIREHASDQPAVAANLLDLQPASPPPASPKPKVARAKRQPVPDVDEDSIVAGARDVRVDQLIADAARSPRQRTRTLGERLRVTLEEVRKALSEEAVRRAEAERLAKVRRELADTIARLEGELAAAKLQMAKARVKA